MTVDLDEAGLVRFARLIACEVLPGDLVLLSGDLGAGKSTFARALIRARLGDDDAEVPSPTFALIQPYDTPGLSVVHADLYRLDDEAMTTELGLDEAIAKGAVIVEWPERAPLIATTDALSAHRLTIRLSEIDGGRRRRMDIGGRGRWPARLARLAEIEAFLTASGWSGARPVPMSADASARRYMRLADETRLALVMDSPRMPDGPPIRDGKPYSRIAHIAEDIRPFVAIARHLRALGLSAPEILAQDLDKGLLVLEDLGPRVYGAEIEHGTPQPLLWRVAVDALLALHAAPAPSRLAVDANEHHVVPDFDLTAMSIEIDLLLDWYVPMLTGAPADTSLRAGFSAAWLPVLDRLHAEPRTLLLRDFHSPNLIWLPERPAPANVGIIDFQDAMLGSAAYDLVSVLQDARLDVPPELEAELLDHYARQAAQRVPGFEADRFAFAYAAFGAQRNTKILGIFARLARRDGKPRYLRHIPRIWRYLARNLDHPGLAQLRSWYDYAFPAPLRDRVPGAGSR